jgi:hypothetical protein
MRLRDKVAIITGGAHGMGEAEARLFAGEGAKVVVADILVGDAEAVAADIRADGGEAISAKIDVTSEAEWTGLIAKTLAVYGRLDILVNNAGISGSSAATLMAWTAGTGSSRSTRRASFWARNLPPSKWRRPAAGRSSTSAPSWGLLAASAAIRPITPRRARCGSIPKPLRCATDLPGCGSTPCIRAICRRC